MGTRTQSPSQLHKKQTTSVEGNVVRRSTPQIRHQGRLNPHLRGMSAAGIRALKRQKIRLVLLGIFGSIAIVGLCGIMLMTMDKSSQLADEVRLKEDELDQINVANDAREYEIGNSVDLNYIIEVATSELGMVRSNLSQVVTFRTKDTEYLQQVAQVPVE